MKQWICTLGLLIGLTTSGAVYGQAFKRTDRNTNYQINDATAMQRVMTTFPNPAQHQTTIILAQRTRRSMTAEVLDYNGNIYKSYAFAPGTDQVSIDLGTLERGNYIIRIVEPGRAVETVKLIKN